MAEVRFIDPAIEDLRRLPPSTVAKVLKKLLLLEGDPKAGHPLGGPLTGFRKVTVGNRDWRIVYREIPGGVIEVCEVWAIGARADEEIYEEATARVRSLPPTPTTRALVDVLTRLNTREVIHEAQPEALPPWLVERLVYTAGLSPEVVEHMTPDEALEAWVEYRNGRRP